MGQASESQRDLRDRALRRAANAHSRGVSSGRRGHTTLAERQFDMAKAQMAVADQPIDAELELDTEHRSAAAHVVVFDAAGETVLLESDIEVCVCESEDDGLVSLIAGDEVFVIARRAFEELWRRGPTGPAVVDSPLEAGGGVVLTEIEAVAASVGGQIGFRVVADGLVLLPVVVRRSRCGDAATVLRLGHLDVLIADAEWEKAWSKRQFIA